MTRALEQHVGTVVELGPEKSLFSWLILNGAKVVNKLTLRLLGRRLSPLHQRLLSWHTGKFFERRIAAANCDILYAPFASVEIADLKTSLPLIYHTDMTWADALNYYPVYTALFPFVKRNGELIQTMAFRKANEAILPTHWAARSAIVHYGMDAERVTVACYGANFNPEDLPSRADAIEGHIHPDIRLLWIGVDWVRKGGKVAYDCLLDLLRRNYKASLTICGCMPPSEFRHPQVKVIPFLSKRDPVQRAQLSRLFMESTFLIFPTVNEAAAIVLCEASAHGLPALATDTGGVSTAISHGVNGFLLPPHATGAQYADQALAVFTDAASYRRVLETSRELFEKSLNWDAWGRSVRPVFERVAAEVTKE